MLKYEITLLIFRLKLTSSRVWPFKVHRKNFNRKFAFEGIYLYFARNKWSKFKLANLWREFYYLSLSRFSLFTEGVSEPETGGFDRSSAGEDGSSGEHTKRYPVVTVEFERVKTPFIIGLWIFCASIAKIGESITIALFFYQTIERIWKI